MPDDIDFERELLLAMKIHANKLGLKSDVPLRAALQALGLYEREKMEVALCNGGDEDPTVKRAYDKLRELVRRELAEGRGNLKFPAGPRYTECNVNAAGLRRLDELMNISQTPGDGE